MTFFTRGIPVAFLALLTTLSGCAAFREGNIPRYPSVPEAGIAKHKSISVKVYGAVILNDQIYRSHPKAMKTWRQQTITAYEKSGYFSEVKEDTGKADLYSEVVIVDKGNPNAFFAFITGLTLYLMPSKATDEFTVKTTITDGDGDILGAFEKRETVTLWQQLIMIFAMPFNWPSSVAKEALYDLSRATIQDAHAEGIL
jgi:hypothetical protein